MIFSSYLFYISLYFVEALVFHIQVHVSIFQSWYEYNDLLEAWDLFLRGSKQLNASETYLYDVVDITRQVLQVLADEYYKEVVCAFKSKDVDTFQ